MNIPTAQEFIESTELVVKFDNTNGCILEEELPNLLKNFAKLHVQAALESAVVNVDAELVDTTDDSRGLIVISPRSILNSYPLTNIK